MRDFLNALLKRYDLHDVDLSVIVDGVLVGRGIATDDPTRFDEQSLYRVASISKLFVATAVLRAWEQGHLQLDDDIRTHLPYVPRNPHHPDVPITLRMLLSHASSIADGSHYWINPSESLVDLFNSPDNLDKFMTFATIDGQHPAPGERFFYCNVGYILLAAVLETVTNERFDEHIKTHILTPLGMSGGFTVNTIEPRHRIVPLYRREQGHWVAQFDQTPQQMDFRQYQLGTNPTPMAPQGGLRANTLELAKFVPVLLGERPDILMASTLKNMTSIAHQDTVWHPWETYGLGIHILDPRDPWVPSGDYPRSLHGHTGVAYGLNAMFYLDLDTKNGVIFAATGEGRPRSDYERDNAILLAFQQDVLTFVRTTYWTEKK